MLGIQFKASLIERERERELDCLAIIGFNGFCVHVYLLRTSNSIVG